MPGGESSSRVSDHEKGKRKRAGREEPFCNRGGETEKKKKKAFEVCNSEKKRSHPRKTGKFVGRKRGEPSKLQQVAITPR